MKIWNSYGSEHSANLVMIGTFKSAESAEKAKAVIDKLSDLLRASDEDLYSGERFPNDVLNLLQELNFHSLAPSELVQFVFEVNSELIGNQIKLTTDEIDVSAFLKLLIDNGARVEVYSNHDYPSTS